MAKKFFNVCAGIFLLALSYHLGARTAVAQAPSNPVVGFTSNYAITANGDVYRCGAAGNDPCQPWTHCTNIFAGGPVPTAQESVGQLKVRYR